MASRPDPDTTRHRREAVALLLLHRRRYDLPALIRAHGITPRPFRRIAPTEALRSDLAAPYFALIRAWQAERDRLLTAYSVALPDRGNPLAPDAAASVKRAADDSAARIAAALALFVRQFPPALASVDRWHRMQWLQRVKAATGLDVAMFTASDTGAVVANAAAWNEQLAQSVHDDTRQAITGALLGGLATRSPAAAVATRVNGVLAKGKARAARIAVDQAEKVTGEMTRARAAAAGLTRFQWHHTPQPRPRPEHRARDKRVYTQANAPNDRAGTLPFCQCWEEPLFT